MILFLGEVFDVQGFGDYEYEYDEEYEYNDDSEYDEYGDFEGDSNDIDIRSGRTLNNNAEKKSNSITTSTSTTTTTKKPVVVRTKKPILQYKYRLIKNGN